MIYQQIDARSSDSSYYIKEIDKQYSFPNKYVYMVEGDIDVTFNEKKMNFYIEVYVANNFFLPNDFLKGSLNLPSQEITDISFINTYKRPNPVVGKNWPSTTYIYSANVTIDLTEDNYLGSLDNKSIQMDLNFTCDSTSLNKDNADIDAQTFQEFISELENSSLKFIFNLKNSVLINKDTTDYFEYTYNLKSDRTQSATGASITFKLPNYSNRNLYIYDLFEIADITSNSNFDIEVDKLTVNYSKDGKREEVSTDLYDDTSFQNNFKYTLDDYEMYWDPQSNEPTFQNGTNGINFPFDTYGYYKIGFYITYMNRSIYYEITNEFTYKISSNFSINVENTNDELVSNYKTIYEN